MSDNNCEFDWPESREPVADVAVSVQSVNSPPRRACRTHLLVMVDPCSSREDA